MPEIYLSPSSQDKNLYYDSSESEEYYMNLVADALIPYLVSNGIRYVRNDREKTAADFIKESNQKDYDLHLALHSNAAPAENAGKVQGSYFFYYPGSKKGKRFANIASNNFKAIYPDPNLVKTVPTTTLGEVARTKAPSVLIETAFHDNPKDAEWIKDNIELIARNLALSLTEYFNLPFSEAMAPRRGRVNVRYGRLNIRSYPSVMAHIKIAANDGDSINVLGQVGDWYVVEYKDEIGYAKAGYIEIV